MLYKLKEEYLDWYREHPDLAVLRFVAYHPTGIQDYLNKELIRIVKSVYPDNVPKNRITEAKVFADGYDLVMIRTECKLLMEAGTFTQSLMSLISTEIELLVLHRILLKNLSIDLVKETLRFPTIDPDDGFWEKVISIFKNRIVATAQSYPEEYEIKDCSSEPSFFTPGFNIRRYVVEHIIEWGRDITKLAEKS